MRRHLTSGIAPLWRPLALLGLALTLALAACGTTQSQWETLQTDGSAQVISLSPDAHNPNIVYIGTDRGEIYRAFASSSSQPTAGHGVPVNAQITALLSDPTRANVILAATSQGIERSQDGGKNWAFYGNGLPATDMVLSLASAGNGVLLAGLARQGMYRSKDDGATWAKVSLPSFAGVGVRALLCVGGACYAGLAQSQAEINLYISTDSGQTWAPGLTGRAEAINALTSLPAPHASTQPSIFAATSRGLIESSDGGATWAHNASGLPSGAVTALARYPAQPQWLLAAVNGQVYRSEDGGKQWSALAPGLGSLGASVTGLAVATSPQSGAVVYAAAGHQLARYPAAAGASNLLASVIALLILLALIPLIIYRVRVSFRRFREDHLPRRKGPSAEHGASGDSAGASSDVHGAQNDQNIQAERNR